MASFSSPGIGSGLDVNSMVSQLLAIERKPIDVLLNRQTGLRAKISALGTVKSLVATLETSAKDLKTASTFTTPKATVGDTAVASASATSSAVAGSYALDVVKLAKSQIVNTAAAPNVATGKLTIAVGGNAAVDVAVTAGESLSTIASRINADATLKTQVKASVIDNRLVLESANTGAANTITVDGVANDGGNGLDGFDTTQSFARTQLSMPGTMVDGTLSLNVGGAGAVNLNVLATDTVTDLVNKINGDPTLSTQIVASESGGQLVLESLVPNVGFTVAGTETAPPNTGLDALDATVAAPPAAMTEARAAQDAEVKLNGITLTRSSNTISDAITGVTLTLTKESAGTPTTLTVGNDATDIATKVDAFVKAFNDVNANLRKATAYDAATQTGSALTGDSAARSVGNQLRRALNTVPAGLDAGYTQLSAIGITTKVDGSLVVDSSKLKAAFEANPESVAKLVAGYGKEMETAAKGLNGTGGLIEGRVNGLNASVKDIDKRSVELERRLTLTEARLKSQFSSLDTLVSNMNKTSSFLTQQLANLS